MLVGMDVLMHQITEHVQDQHLRLENSLDIVCGNVEHYIRQKLQFLLPLSGQADTAQFFSSWNKTCILNKYDWRS